MQDSDDELYGKVQFWDSQEEYEMTKSEEILEKVTATSTLVDRLWDKDDPGSISALHVKLDRLNGQVRGNTVRSKVNQVILYLLIGGSGISAGITKLTGLW